MSNIFLFQIKIHLLVIVIDRASVIYEPIYILYGVIIRSEVLIGWLYTFLSN